MRPISTVRPVCLLVAAVLVLASTTHAAEFDQDKLSTIRTRMQRFVDDHQIAGIVTVVGSSKGIAGLEAIGNLRVEGKQPMPKDAVFRIASMTKPITAAGI